MAKVLYKVVYYYFRALSRASYILKPLFLASVLGGIMGALSSPAKAEPPGDSCNWQLTFSDNFDTLDRTKWNTVWPQYYNGSLHLDGRVRRQAYYPDSNVQTAYDPNVNSNVLAIRTAREDTIVDWLNNAVYRYTSGTINSETKFSQQYGYFEVRAKLPTTKGSAPSFWLMNFSKNLADEIDVVEVPGLQKGLEVVQNIHWEKNENPHYHLLSDGDTGSKYRTYGVLWEQDRIVWYIDGQEVFRSPNKMSSISMSLVLSNEVDGGPGNTFYDDLTQGNYPLLSLFDHVKVWSKTQQPCKNTAL
ncbi:MAG TPA: hypothetical protein DEV81_10095 [Cyanobacteria bacterium UBA11049]|nr:hypothetical protein [Cyanobacteria bacterium UBA11049]